MLGVGAKSSVDGDGAADLCGDGALDRVEAKA